MVHSAIAKATEESLFGGDPQNSRRPFDDPLDIEAFVLFSTETDILQLPVTAGLAKRMEAVVCAEPDRSGTVLIESGNRLGTTSLGWKVSSEFGFRGGGERIEACEAGGGCDPVIAALSNEQVVNHSMGQSVGDAVIYEFITVETRQAVGGAEPEIAKRIGDYFVNAVAGETIRGGVRSDRKLFGTELRTGCQDEEKDGKNSLHGPIS